MVYPAATPNDGFDWPPVADGLAGLQLVAIARVIERLCGTQAAANYLAEALAKPSSRIVLVKPTNRLKAVTLERSMPPQDN